MTTHRSRVSIGEVCEVRKGTSITQKDTEPGEVPVVAGGIQPTYTHAVANRSAGAVTVSASGANAGFVNYWSVPIFASDCTTIEPSPNSLVDRRFLFHQMKALEPLIQDTLRRGAAQPHVYPRDIAALEIHLPALEDQRRIATVLDAAYTMRTKRRRALAKLDTLTQAIYIDMFGDPRTPTAKWARLELGEAGTIHTGKTPPGNKAGMFGEDVPFVTPGDLEADRQPARWLSLRGVDHVRVVPEGSTLVCCIGATIGKVGEARRPSAFNQQINAIDWDRSRVDPSFGTQTMRFLGTDVARLGASTTMPILKKSSFAKMLVPVPPLTEQREFASRRAVVALRRHEMRSSREILDQLFASLQQRAFRGEL